MFLGKKERGEMRCPECDGKSIAGRNDPAVIRLILRREHAAQTTPDQSFDARGKPTPPPPDFSKADGKVPLFGADRARDERRRQIAADIQAVAAKLHEMPKKEVPHE